MKIKNYKLSEKTIKLLTTELTFLAVSSRVEGFDLIRLEFDSELDGQRINNVTKILRMLKREKKISLFLSSEDFDKDLTEASYLKNLYPTLEKDSDSNYFIVVKI